MNQLRTWVAQWGDLANVAGLLVTIVGFGISIFGIWRSKTAAEQARQAAISVKDSLALHGAIADLSAAIGIMGEIKRFQRLNAWGVLPDRYSELRRCLVAIKASESHLNDGQQQKLQLAIQTFADLERKVERAALAEGIPPNPAKLNDIVSGQIDEVHAVLLSVQQLLRLEND